MVVETAGAHMIKITKDKANYTDYQRVRQCKFCSMFRPPSGCTLVKGTINPSGGCKFWEKKK